MTFLISHRGNLSGPNPTAENSPEYLREALEAGFQVEVDVWLHRDKFYLGHDEPKYQVTPKFLLFDFTNPYSTGLYRTSPFWCHAKNLEAVHELSIYGQSVHWFWHQTDDVALTSKNVLWTYPGKRILRKMHLPTIAVMPELAPEWDISEADGICSDYIVNYDRRNA